MNDYGLEFLLADERAGSRCAGVRDGDLPFAMAPAGARAAVLLVHGFAATPWEMRPLAADLAERGFAAMAVRLPGHGTTPEDLAGRRWEEWLDGVVRGYDLLAAHFTRVYAAGLSTGSLLLLALARQRRPAGLILLSPYLRMTHRLAPCAGWLRHIKPYEHRQLNGEAAEHYYARRPLAGVHQINRLLQEISPQLEEIDLPVLAIHGEGDRTIDIDSGRRLVEHLGSTIKTYKRFGPEATHTLTAVGNPHRGAVFALIGKFLDELEDQLCMPESSRR